MSETVNTGGALEIAYGQHLGMVRSLQEDMVWAGGPPDQEHLAQKGYLCVVADGMGGHQAGEVASAYSLHSLFEEYYRDPSPDVYATLNRSIQQVHADLQHQASTDPAKSGMGTTIVVAVVKGPELFVANVGDSRAYLLRDGQLRLVSQDQSWVWDQVEQGVLTPAEARVHPKRNEILQALGMPQPIAVYHPVSSIVLRPGDQVLLCSDGLTGPLADDEIQAFLERYPANRAVDHLIDAANARGGPDNVSVVVIRVPGAVPIYALPESSGAGTTVSLPTGQSKSERRSLLLRVLVSLAAVVLIVSLAVLMLPPRPPVPPGNGTPEATVTAAVLASTATLAPSTPAPGGNATVTPRPSAAAATSPSPNVTASARQPSPPPAATKGVAPVEAPRLISPEDGASASGRTQFTWSWSGHLEVNQGFELRIWQDGSPDHLGAAEPVIEPLVWFDVPQSPAVRKGGPGKYYWTVAVVDKLGGRIGPEAEPRILTVDTGGGTVGPDRPLQH